MRPHPRGYVYRTLRNVRPCTLNKTPKLRLAGHHGSVSTTRTCLTDALAYIHHMHGRMITPQGHPHDKPVGCLQSQGAGACWTASHDKAGTTTVAPKRKQLTGTSATAPNWGELRRRSASWPQSCQATHRRPISRRQRRHGTVGARDRHRDPRIPTRL